MRHPIKTLAVWALALMVASAALFGFRLRITWGDPWCEGQTQHPTEAR